ncbi:MAG: hypothetical protein Q8P50_14520 [Bacillota bacterium]|nr:hypothetical protein [Bacillota bacterium]
MNGPLEVQWLGPFRFFDSRGAVHGVGDRQGYRKLPECVRNEPGVYLWTILVGDEYWVHDVGQCTALRRWIQHDRGCLLNGMYWFHDPKRLALGEVRPVYSPNRAEDREKLLQDEVLKSQLREYAGLVHLFVTYATGPEPRLRRRLETSLAFHLKGTPAGSMLWGDWNDADLMDEGENAITVRFSSKAKIAGMPESLEV